MKKIAGFLSLALTAALLSGCTPRYVVQTKDGQTLTAVGKPVTDDTTGMISFKTEEGKQLEINKDNVIQFSKK